MRKCNTKTEHEINQVFPSVAPKNASGEKFSLSRTHPTTPIQEETRNLPFTKCSRNLEKMGRGLINYSRSRKNDR